jgi:hypothetical protein
MQILKRIFGKGNAESDKTVENAIEQIKAGEITKIYPILKPGDWVGIQAGALKQTLLGTQESPRLVVAFGYDTPSNFVFLMPPDLEGKDPDQVLQNAYQNLEDVSIAFEPVMDGRIVTASGHDFSSEKILCADHLQKAHELLQSDALLVSVPRRRCLMATAHQAGDQVLDAFLAIHNKVWEDDLYGNAPILNALFVIENGKIKGVIPLDK